MPYVLVTDWREAKPCMEILARRNAQSRPVFTVVICEVMGQYGRASRWAESLSEDMTDPVYICQRLTCPHSFVYGLLAQLKHVLNKNAMSTLLSLSLDRNAWPQMEACHISNKVDAHSVDDSEDAEERQLAGPAWQVQDAEEPCVFQPAEPAWQPQDVGQVMQTCWDKCAGPVHMEQLLREAMPEKYDD